MPADAQTPPVARRNARAARHRRQWLACVATALTIVGIVGASSLVGVGASAATPSGGLAATATPATPVDSDRRSVELGVKFQVSTAGTITGIEYYSTPANRGEHVGSLWGPDGKRLASATFPASTRTGWVSATFTEPVAVEPGKTYVASYLAPRGGYSVTENYFTQTRTAGEVTFPKNAGVYRYGKGGFPTSVYRASNYFVDVLYLPSGTIAPTAKPSATPSVTPKPQASTAQKPSTTPKPTATQTATATATPSPTPTATSKPTTSATPLPTASSVPQSTTPSSNQKNCINVPSACGYPDETNTGVNAGSALTRVPEDATSGPGWSWRSDIRAIETTRDGVTLENLSIGNGSINVLNAAVTIRNVYIGANTYYPINCSYGGATRAAWSCLGLVAEDVEINATPMCQAGMSFSGYTARRVYIHGCTDGFKADSDVLIESSYVTALAVEPGSHNDGVQSTADGNLVVRNSTFKLGNQSGINAVFQMGVSIGRDVTIQGNLIDGGGYMLNSTPITNILVKDNRFTRRSNYGIGYVSGGSWTGNIWDDTGTLVPLND